MRYQHCGRLNDHPEHDFAARQRVVVESCVCDHLTCICPETPAELQRWSQQKQKLRCPGRLIKEGASAHMPVKVEL